MSLLQIPDERTGKDIIEAVVVDEEAVGGCGAKILHGEGAFDQYLSQHTVKDSVADGGPEAEEEEAEFPSIAAL